MPFEIEEDRRHRLLNGLDDIALTLQQADAIAAYETDRERARAGHAGTVITLDHCVIAVSDWERSNAFYRDVVGAEIVSRGAGFAYRLGAQQLNVHGPGLDPDPVARERVRPGNSDLCFVWDGPIEAAGGAPASATRRDRARPGDPPRRARRGHERLLPRPRRFPLWSSSAMPKIALLPGDGIGPEVTAAAVRVLDAVAGDLTYEEHPVGGAGIDAHGVAITDEAMAAIKAADAILLGAVGGPQWDSNDPAAVRPEQALFRLRKDLGLYANIRPIRPLRALYDASPLKRDRIEDTDMIIVRELTGGLYFGERGTKDGRAFDTCVYTVEEIERIARSGVRARELARDERRQGQRARHQPAVARGRHPRARRGVPAPRARAPARRLCAMRLISEPRHFDVILTENMFGDILSDEASMLTGSLGMLPTASLGGDGPAMFEPVHGSAPDIAGQGIANPLGMILSAALLLRQDSAGKRRPLP